MKGGAVDQSQDDAAVFGMVLDTEPEQDFFEVEPEVWPVLEAFLRVQTQWRTGPNGLIGLDYQALEWTFRLWNVEDAASMLADIQVIEAEILLALSEQEG